MLDCSRAQLRSINRLVRRKDLNVQAFTLRDIDIDTALDIDHTIAMEWTRKNRKLRALIEPNGNVPYLTDVGVSRL